MAKTEIFFYIHLRRIIINSCKRFKCLFHEVRERASKALGFAKMLRKVSPTPGWNSRASLAGHARDLPSSLGRFARFPCSNSYLFCPASLWGRILSLILYFGFLIFFQDLEIAAEFLKLVPTKELLRLEYWRLGAGASWNHGFRTRGSTRYFVMELGWRAMSKNPYMYGSIVCQMSSWKMF